MEEVVGRWRVRVRWRGLGEMEGGRLRLRWRGWVGEGWRKGGGGYEEWERWRKMEGGQEEERKEGRKKSLAM